MNQYTVVIAGVEGSVTYRVSARDAVQAIKDAFYQRNKNTDSSVSSVVLTKVSNIV